MIRMKEVVVTVDFRVNIVCKDDAAAQILAEKIMIDNVAEDAYKTNLLETIRNISKLKRITTKKATKADIRSLKKCSDIRIQAQEGQA